jgi:hypothetical protein
VDPGANQISITAQGFEEAKLLRTYVQTLETRQVDAQLPFASTQQSAAVEENVNPKLQTGTSPSIWGAIWNISEYSRRKVTAKD